MTVKFCPGCSVPRHPVFHQGEHRAAFELHSPDEHPPSGKVVLIKWQGEWRRGYYRARVSERWPGVWYRLPGYWRVYAVECWRYLPGEESFGALADEVRSMFPGELSL